MPKLISKDDVRALALGGTIFGGGGGGRTETGIHEGYFALELGKVELWSQALAP